MTGKQHAVLWLGLLLIITRLFTTGQWSTIWTALSTNVAGTGQAGQSGGSDPFHLPHVPIIGGLIPGTTSAAPKHPTRQPPPVQVV